VGERDSLAFSSDGKNLSSGCNDQTTKLWDPQSGVLRKTLTGPQHRLACLASSPDGMTFASGSCGPESLVWLRQTGGVE
jgi:WD40 repeat protein